MKRVGNIFGPSVNRELPCSGCLENVLVFIFTKIFSVAKGHCGVLETGIFSARIHLRKSINLWND